MAPPTTEFNQSKIRIGLAMVSLVFIGSVVGFFTFASGDTLGQAVMVGVALVALVRVGLLARSLRRDAKAG